MSAALDAIYHIARTAAKNRKPLRGDGPYADRFHAAALELSIALAALFRLAEPDATWVSELATVTAPLTERGTSTEERGESRKAAISILKLKVEPYLASLQGPSVTFDEHVLPLSALGAAPGYFHSLVLQANGCFERRWYDACAVMIRKIVEGLIIELYERGGVADEIRKDGEYLMLNGLVTKLLSQSRWTLGREVRSVLPDLKRLGDRSAHTRHYQCRKADVEHVLPGLRVAVDQLCHHSKVA